MVRALRNRALAIAFVLLLAACQATAPRSDSPVERFTPGGSRTFADDLISFSYPKQFKVARDSGFIAVLYEFEFRVPGDAPATTARDRLRGIGRCSLRVFYAQSPKLTPAENRAGLQRYLWQGLALKKPKKAGAPFTPKRPGPSVDAPRMGIPYTVRLGDRDETALGTTGQDSWFTMVFMAQPIELGNKRGVVSCDVWEAHRDEALDLFDSLSASLEITEKAQRWKMRDYSLTSDIWRSRPIDADAYGAPYRDHATVEAAGREDIGFRLGPLWQHERFETDDGRPRHMLTLESSKRFVVAASGYVQTARCSIGTEADAGPRTKEQIRRALFDRLRLDFPRIPERVFSELTKTQHYLRGEWPVELLGHIDGDMRIRDGADLFSIELKARLVRRGPLLVSVVCVGHFDHASHMSNLTFDLYRTVEPGR